MTQIIYIWKLWCVDYDEAFQRQVAEEYPRWVPKASRKAQAPAPKHEDNERRFNAPSERGPEAGSAEGTRRSDRLQDKPRRSYRELAGVQDTSPQGQRVKNEESEE